MKRLTERTKYGIVGNNNGVENFPLYSLYDETHLDHGLIEQCFNKLAEYEDLEEQGLLLRLPVPEGAVVYTLSYIYECKFDYDCKEFDAYKCEEDIPCEHQYKVYRVKETKFQKQMLAMLGKTVFLTKEEAEQALERLEKDDG